jgi:hypothetical protein
LLSRERPDLLLEVEPGHLARQGSSPAEIDALLGEHGYALFEPLAGRPLELRRLELAAGLSDGPNILASCAPERLERAGLKVL